MDVIILKLLFCAAGFVLLVISFAIGEDENRGGLSFLGLVIGLCLIVGSLLSSI